MQPELAGVLLGQPPEGAHHQGVVDSARCDNAGDFSERARRDLNVFAVVQLRLRDFPAVFDEIGVAVIVEERRLPWPLSCPR